MKIKANNIHVAFDSTEILKDISIKADSGEIVGIIGPNGSGKSTFLKCIYRVLKPNEGTIWLDEEVMSTMRVKETASKLAVVAQHNQYSFDFTVEDIVLMGRSPYKRALENDNEEDYRIVQEVLKLVEMSDFRDRSFATLSGGEQQRIILARALAQQAQCLVLDEPTNHLDITHQLQTMQIVRKLGITIIAAFHDLNIAAAYCDKLYVLRDGEVVRYGTPQEILTPTTIREIYDVEVEVVRDKNGRMHILFLS